MKKAKGKLGLQKTKITKLSNMRLIIGGDPKSKYAGSQNCGSGVCHTDGIAEGAGSRNGDCRSGGNRGAQG